MTNEEFQKLVLEELRSLKEGQARIEKNIVSIMEDDKSVNEILGEHEVSIRTLRRSPV